VHRVGRRLAVARSVLADDLVALDDPVGEALGQRAGVGVALEAALADQVELAVPVTVVLGQEHALLGARELDRDLEHELAQVAGVTVAPVHRHHLLAQLAGPFALGPTGALGAQPQLALLRQALALGLELLAKALGVASGLGRLRLELLGTSGHFPAPLLVEGGVAPCGRALVGPGAKPGHGGGGEDREQDRVRDAAVADQDDQQCRCGDREQNERDCGEPTPHCGVRCVHSEAIPLRRSLYSRIGARGPKFSSRGPGRSPSAAPRRCPRRS